MIICRAWITLKDGRRLYAKDLGKKAFCWDTDKNRSTKKATPSEEVTSTENIKES